MGAVAAGQVRPVQQARDPRALPLQEQRQGDGHRPRGQGGIRIWHHVFPGQSDGLHSFKNNQ